MLCLGLFDRIEEVDLFRKLAYVGERREDKLSERRCARTLGETLGKGAPRAQLVLLLSLCICPAGMAFANEAKRRGKDWEQSGEVCRSAWVVVTCANGSEANDINVGKQQVMIRDGGVLLVNTLGSNHKKNKFHYHHYYPGFKPNQNGMLIRIPISGLLDLVPDLAGLMVIRR